MDIILQLINVSKKFNGIIALSDISLKIAKHEVVGLIGPNGSGKTTIFNIVSRLTEPTSGRLILFDKDVLSLEPHEIPRKGLARIFQTPQLCADLTVLENVALGSYAHLKKHSRFFSLWRHKSKETNLTAISEILHFIELNRKWDQFPDTLSHFERRKLELARALVGNPKLLLLDEPTSGFARTERDLFASLINKIREQEVTILIIEHDLSLIQQVSDRVIVLDAGRKIAEGSPDSIARDKAVAEVYIGDINAEGQ